MAQLGDVQLGSAQYMVEPGTYRRLSDGAPEGRPGRWVMNDFIAGMLRPLQLERETAWDGESVGPALGGQGVMPWPLEVVFRDNVLRTVDSSRRAIVQQIGDKLFLGYKQYVYEAPAISAGSWSAVVQRADLGSPRIVTDMMEYKGLLYIAVGNTGDIRVMDPLSYAVSTVASVKARYFEPYGGQFVFSNPLTGSEDQLLFSTGGGVDSRDLDSEILGMCLHNSSVAVATRQGIYLVGGKPDAVNGVWIGEPQPIFSSGAYSDDRDYVFLQSYGGKLYTALFGNVMEWNPNAGNNRQGWRSTGLDYRNCYGATVSNGIMFVGTLSNEGYYELWAFDGTGWWCVDRTTVNARMWPGNTAGAGSYDMIVFRNNDSNVDYQLYRLKPRSLAEPAYATAGNYDTALIDAGERDKLKAWRTIAAYFATPEIKGNPASIDSVTVKLHYSIDCGKTWTQAATMTVNDPTTREHLLSADLGSGAKVSRYLQLRVEWSSVSDWTPILVGLMAEHELLDQPSRRRRWELTVRPRDTTQLRDGNGVDPRTGQQIAADLWAAWSAGTTVAMRDVDYDLNSQTYQVRVTGIDEKRESTADGGRWTDSKVKLTLVEI